MASVTTILEPWIDKEWFTEEARARGTAVHDASYAHLSGLWVPPLLPGWQPYFDSFRRWADVSIDKIILIERRLYSDKYGYNGKPDFVGVLHGDEENTLVDWKTALDHSWWWPLQNVAYRQLLLEVSPEAIPTYRGASLRLKNDGSMPKFYDYSGRSFNSDINAFFGGLVMWNFREKGGK